MDTLGYPAVEEHKAYHQEFREWLGDLKENYGERQNGLVVSEISEYLGNWLYDHILNVDMAYKDFLEQMKDDVPPLLAGYDGVSSAPEV